jgi:hypothetical protein
MTHRPVDVASVQVNPFTGRIGVQGLRVFERDGGTLFTDFDRLDLRVKPLALLGGHVWIRDAVLQGSTVRVVRFGDEFNFSDLVKTEGPSGGVRRVVNALEVQPAPAGAAGGSS